MTRRCYEGAREEVEHRAFDINPARVLVHDAPEVRGHTSKRWVLPISRLTSDASGDTYP